MTAHKCSACGQTVRPTGYRTVTQLQARRMAKAAGLTEDMVNNCGFRDVMAEHAVKLMISITKKEIGSYARYRKA